jgi:hypothetical protein
MLGSVSDFVILKGLWFGSIKRAEFIFSGCLNSTYLSPQPANNIEIVIKNIINDIQAVCLIAAKISDIRFKFLLSVWNS